MSRFEKIIGFGDDFISLLFPRICHSCGVSLVRNERVLCLSCLADFPLTQYHTTKDNMLEQELWGRCYLERAAAMCFYRRDGRIQNLMHRLKYYGIREIAYYLGEMYGHMLNDSEFLSDVDYLIPVPLHPSKERKRGFNQSSLIAEGVSLSTGIPVNDKALIRKVHSSTQTRKSRVDRWENVENIFSLDDFEELKDRHLLLVDDVITTGSTIESCVNVLKNIKGVRVSALAIATAVQ